MFRLITIDFSQKSPHFSLLSPTSPCELSEREVTSPCNLKVVGALDNYSLVFVIFINFFGQLKDGVGQVLFLVSCPKGQVEKYVNVEAWCPMDTFFHVSNILILILLCLTPLSAIFQLYHSDQFWWKKPEYLERTTDHGRVTDKLYHLQLRVQCTLFVIFVIYKARCEPTP